MGYRFLDDFVLLYPVYTLLFSDTGLSVGQISSLFVIWAIASLVFEVPSGALADTTSRRALLIVAPLLTVVTFAMWVTVPSYGVFMVGFVLWGLKSAVAVLFPENAIRSADDDGGWGATLLAGVDEARRSGPVRAAVLFVVVVTAIWGALDEYAPLLVAEYGVDEAGVSLLMVVVWAVAAAGGLLAGRVTALGTTPLAVVICGGATAMAAGGLLGHPAGAVLLGAAFGAFQLTTIVADARLQHRISGPARATVTSVAGMSTDVLTIAVYGSYAALAGVGGHGGAFALLMLPYVMLAGWLVAAKAR